MTISERVYQVILKAYPPDYRREYGEPMLQLLRDQMRACGPGRWRVVQLWLQILADTARAAPALHLNLLTSSGDGMMRKRTKVALACSMLFAGCGYPWVARALRAIPGASAFIHAHMPSTWPASFVYVTAVWALNDLLTVVLAVALFLAIMRKFSLDRLSLGALVAVPIVAAGVTGQQFILVLQLPLLVRGTAWILPLLISVAVAAWAAIGRRQERDVVGPDQPAVPIPG